MSPVASWNRHLGQFVGRISARRAAGATCAETRANKAIKQGQPPFIPPPGPSDTPETGRNGLTWAQAFLGSLDARGRMLSRRELKTLLPGLQQGRAIQNMVGNHRRRAPSLILRPLRGKLAPMHEF